MKMHDPDRISDSWLERLDEIVAGENVPLATDDELHQLAMQLATALKSLREIHASAKIKQQDMPSNLPVRNSRISQKSLPFPSRFCLLITALLLFVLILTMISSGGILAIQNNAVKVWHTSTSLDQIDGISVASGSKPHAGLKPLPLLPALLPDDTQATAFGVITDEPQPNILKVFVANYRIDGKDVLLYEQPSYGPFLSSVAKAVRIGTISGQLFQDDAGENALQWYQQGMLCQVTSKLPVGRLLALASVFQPIKNWDLLL
jgi:hypothetical protein